MTCRPRSSSACFGISNLDAPFGLVRASRPYHDRVFRVEELPDLIATYGVPVDRVDDAYHGYHRRPFEKYIEVQVWADDPIRSFA